MRKRIIYFSGSPGNGDSGGGAGTGGGGGDSIFDSLLSTVFWDGTNQQINLTGNIALFTNQNPTLGCILFHQDATGGRTVTLNGTPVVLNTSPLSYTVGKLFLKFGVLGFVTDESWITLGAPPVPGIPTILSVVATDSHTIVVTLSAPVTATDLGYTFTRITGLTITGLAGSGTNTLTFTILETLLNIDAITFDYNSGDTKLLEDPSFVLANTSGNVTNNIPAGIVDLSFTLGGSGWTESPAHSFNTGGSTTLASIQKMTGNGFVYAEIPAANTEVTVIGIDSNNTSNAFGAWIRFMYLQGGVINDPINGVVAGYLAGYLWGFRRVGMTLDEVASTDGGTTWVNIGNVSTSSIGDLYFKMVRNAGSLITVKNPKGIGVV